MRIKRTLLSVSALILIVGVVSILSVFSHIFGHHTGTIVELTGIIAAALMLVITIAPSFTMDGEYMRGTTVIIIGLLIIICGEAMGYAHVLSKMTAFDIVAAALLMEVGCVVYSWLAWHRDETADHYIDPATQWSGGPGLRQSK